MANQVVFVTILCYFYLGVKLTVSASYPPSAYQPPRVNYGPPQWPAQESFNKNLDTAFAIGPKNGQRVVSQEQQEHFENAYQLPGNNYVRRSENVPPQWATHETINNDQASAFAISQNTNQRLVSQEQQGSFVKEQSFANANIEQQNYLYQKNQPPSTNTVGQYIMNAGNTYTPQRSFENQPNHFPVNPVYSNVPPIPIQERQTYEPVQERFTPPPELLKFSNEGASPGMRTQQLLNNPQYRNLILSQVPKKRYLIIYPDGSYKSTDYIEEITRQYPNYVMVEGKSKPPQQEFSSTTPNSIPQQSTTIVSNNINYKDIEPQPKEETLYELKPLKTFEVLEPTQQTQKPVYATNLFEENQSGTLDTINYNTANEAVFKNGQSGESKTYIAEVKHQTNLQEPSYIQPNPIPNTAATPEFIPLSGNSISSSPDNTALSHLAKTEQISQIPKTIPVNPINNVQQPNPTIPPQSNIATPTVFSATETETSGTITSTTSSNSVTALASSDSTTNSQANELNIEPNTDLPTSQTVSTNSNVENTNESNLQKENTEVQKSPQTNINTDQLAKTDQLKDLNSIQTTKSTVTSESDVVQSDTQNLEPNSLNPPDSQIHTEELTVTKTSETISNNNQNVQAVQPTINENKTFLKQDDISTSKSLANTQTNEATATTDKVESTSDQSNAEIATSALTSVSGPTPCITGNNVNPCQEFWFDQSGSSSWQKIFGNKNLLGYLLFFQAPEPLFNESS